MNYAIRNISIVFVTLVCFSLHARANQLAADKCRTGLRPEAQLIYDTVFPRVTPSTIIVDVLKEQTRALVIAGKITRSSAKENAEAAGECFRALRK
jgi:hypothetical protein